jgi:hypothetical protein
MASFYVHQGDLLPVLNGALLNPNLSAVDLTGATVELALVEMATGSKTQLPAAVSGNPTQGLVVYRWPPGDTDTSGAYFYRRLVTRPAGVPSTGPESFPNDSRGLVLSVVA